MQKITNTSMFTGIAKQYLQQMLLNMLPLPLFMHLFSSSIAVITVITQQMLTRKVIIHMHSNQCCKTEFLKWY